MSNIHPLYVGNDTVFEITNMHDEVAGVDLNAATVTIALADTSGAPVAGTLWPKLMLYVEGSHGLYRVILPHDMQLTLGGRYVATVVSDAGPGLHAEWRIDCVARTRN